MGLKLNLPYSARQTIYGWMHDNANKGTDLDIANFILNGSFTKDLKISRFNSLIKILIKELEAQGIQVKETASGRYSITKNMLNKLDLNNLLTDTKNKFFNSSLVGLNFQDSHIWKELELLQNEEHINFSHSSYFELFVKLNNYETLEWLINEYGVGFYRGSRLTNCVKILSNHDLEVSQKLTFFDFMKKMKLFDVSSGNIFSAESLIDPQYEYPIEIIVLEKVLKNTPYDTKIIGLDKTFFEDAILNIIVHSNNRVNKPDPFATKTLLESFQSTDSLKLKELFGKVLKDRNFLTWEFIKSGLTPILKYLPDLHDWFSENIDVPFLENYLEEFRPEVKETFLF